MSTHEAVSRGQMGEQLAMFYTAKEIKSRWKMNPGDVEYGGVAATWRMKSRESRAGGLTESLRAEGIHAPVALSPQHIMDGHHRIAGAGRNQLIPAVHVKDSDEEVGSHSPMLRHLKYVDSPVGNW